MEEQKIFFSYARHDAGNFALKLAQKLRNANVNIWIDQLDIHGGQNYNIAIENALGSSTHVLFIVSEKSLRSRYVMNEVNYALDEDKVVIPVILYQAKLPLRLRELQYISFAEDFEEGYNKLMQALDLAKAIGKKDVTYEHVTAAEDDDAYKKATPLNLYNKLRHVISKNMHSVRLATFFKIAIPVLFILFILNFFFRKTRLADEGFDFKPTNPDTVKAVNKTSLPSPADTSFKSLTADQYFDKGKILSGRQRYADAIKNFTGAVKLRPFFEEAYYERALCKEKLNDYEGAIADYTKAIEIKPENIHYAFRGNAKIKLNDYQGAMADYNKAIKLDLSDPYAYSAPARLKEELNDLKGAVADYTKTIELEKDGWHYRDRAEVKKKMGDKAGACEDFKKACALSKYDYDCNLYKKECE